jgi:hypothetical protein
LGVTLDTARAKVVALVGRGDRAPSGHIPFTPQAKRALEGALRETLHLGDHEIGTEHLLLGLIREGDSTAARTLEELDLDLGDVRRRVVEIAAGGAPGPAPHAPHAETGGGVSAFGASLSGRIGACSFCGRDLWEVDRYVLGSQAAICESCAGAAREALDQEPATRVALIPPRVFGDPPDDAAVGDIDDALQAVFSAASTFEERAAAVEGGGESAAGLAFARAAERYPDVVVRVDRIRFDAADTAEVRVLLSITGGIGTVFEGRVVRQQRAWKVGRDLAEAVVRAAGVHTARVQGHEDPETPRS